jgi:hypothetical protein
MEAFLAAYIRVSKEDIRRNGDSAAEQLGFLGRILHGANPRAWLKELRAKLGQPVDYAAAADLGS